MEIQLNALSKSFSAAALKKATAFVVRELEESPPGEFVAFVDDGDNSYDVHAVITNGNVVAKYTCDCPAGSKPMCLHRLAVLLQISQPKDKKNKKITKAKPASQLQQLVEEVPVPELRKWVLELLAQHKDMVLEFKHRFRQGEAEYTVASIEAMTVDAAKSVAKNKRKIDATELKKILQLWQKFHQPVIDEYIRNIVDVEKVNWIAAMIGAIEKKHEDYYEVNTIKFTSYKKDLLQHLVAPLHDIEIMEAWQKVIVAFFKAAIEGAGHGYLTFFNFIITVADLEPSQERVDFIITHFSKIYQRYQNQGSGNISFLAKMLWQFCKSKDRLFMLLDIMQPIHYENEFNIDLINNLIAAGKLDIAEQQCLVCIKSNYSQEYNVPYWRLLKNIYTLTGNTQALFPVLQSLLPLTFLYQDYIVVMKAINAEEQKKLRTQLLSRAANALDHVEAAATFYFNVCIQEKKYTQLLDKLRQCPFAALLVQHFEVLYQFNKTGLLQAIGSLTKRGMQLRAHADIYKQIWLLLSQHYTVPELKKEFAPDRFSYYSSKLQQYIEAEIAALKDGHTLF